MSTNTIALPGKYDRVRVHLKDGYSLEGTYRGRICSPREYWYDDNGSAIWLTNILESFVALNDIESIEILEAYRS